MSRLYRVAMVSEIPPGTAKEVLAGDRVVAVFNVAGEFHALDGVCYHAGGPLAEGELQGEVITCPWHGWQFRVTTGENCLNPRICQVRYRVRVEGDSLFVEVS